MKREPQYFQLEHPPNEVVICDHMACEEVADHLDVDSQGRERRLCASHTSSDKHASRLPKRRPDPNLPYSARPLA
jgi:hypothetical protein